MLIVIGPKITEMDMLNMRIADTIRIFPFIWMVFTSFKSAGESVQIPPTILPKQWMKENYLRAIASLPFMKLYVNTALLILFRVLCAVAFSSAAGFAFAKLKFRG